VPLVLLGIFLLLLLIAMRWVPQRHRRRYAYAGLLLFALGLAGIAGCSGNSSGGGGGGGSHVDTITAKYSGDTNYSSSTSTGTGVTIQ
jgi:multisubunit Na+/H+ antiporter MnhB subunit